MSRQHVVAAVLLVTLGSAVATAQERSFEPVTDAMLQDPDPADWLSWRRTLDGWGYSPLDQINTDNVHQLQLVWAWQLGAGNSQPTPLVHDGVMFIPNTGNSVQAVDAVTGDRLWQYTQARAERPGRDANATPSRGSRSMAIYGDKVYLNTTNAHIVALDARTGEVAWDQTVADRALGYRYTSGPIVANGTIVAGMTGCQNYKNDVCFISGHDPDTGEERWRTSTVAQPGEPGGDTWGDLPLMFRAGADSWIPGSYDPQANLGLPVDLPAEAMGPRVAENRRRRVVLEQRTCARPGDRRSRVVLPVRPGRDPRPGRSVRERADRPQRTPLALQDGQARHSLGARPHHGRLRGRS